MDPFAKPLIDCPKPAKRQKLSESPEPKQYQNRVKTQFIIFSDTHGDDFGLDSSQKADVAIHCGDLTEESKLEEYRDSLRQLIAIQAPLKLVIAGNHDFTMDIPMFRKKVTDSLSPLDPDLVKREYGYEGEVRQMFEDAKDAGVRFLDEGGHRFELVNGAVLTVYASPYTPSQSDWGFQYLPSQGHKFDIGKRVDLVMTHGPPKGIMDVTENKTRAGCPDLFGAVARARPLLHCFGHIHEGWGGKLVTWRKQLTEEPSHFTDIDNNRSMVIEKLSGFTHSKYDTPETKMEKSEKEAFYHQKGFYATSHCSGDEHPLRRGEQTLFVNAAVQGKDYENPQLPWLVELELPRASSD